MATSTASAKEPRHDIEIKQNKETGLVQMKADDYQKVKTNFELLRAKYIEATRKNKALQNLYSALSSKDDELKAFKSRAHKFEIAYIRTETKLTNMCLKLREQSGNSSLDVAAILNALEFNSQLHPATSSNTDFMSNKQNDLHKGNSDLETDGGSSSPRAFAGQLIPRDARIYSDEMDLDSPILSSLAEENKQLKSRLKSFSENSEAWEKFTVNCFCFLFVLRCYSDVCSSASDPK